MKISLTIECFKILISSFSSTIKNKPFRLFPKKYCLKIVKFRTKSLLHLLGNVVQRSNEKQFPLRYEFNISCKTKCRKAIWHNPELLYCFTLAQKVTQICLILTTYSRNMECLQFLSIGAVFSATCNQKGRSDSILRMTEKLLLRKREPFDDNEAIS